ncbi:flagellar hook-associated protein 1 FlgK [Rhodovulum bhavnagarense]|uniref:Flagellar hook-associated protein 1 n=1 Tax=Rhodovulum bhavnagarense TaxID=992286 RepID=A0A4R2RCP1_9RHOB|nr:flagellar hook-associated protein FlgK [Rhodovulum bhavnagarense]TCP61170.1 flagellar hook-associated protein 1 FlgK [Rhodovulum bhavnagarense]
MSLSASLSNALSGLSLATRGAQVVSLNVANATTAGYGRRVIEPTVATLDGSGAGVRIGDVRRESDPLLIAWRRDAEAESQRTEIRTSALDTLEAAFGTPEQGDGLTARLADLDNALILAASRPDSDTRLADVLAAAQTLAESFNTASDRVQTLRQEAETAIATEIERMTTALARIADLNAGIVAAQAGGRDANALLDQRQSLVDTLAGIVPLREYARDGGAIALYSASGATLLDGEAAVLDFAAVNTVTADMTLASGALSHPTLNGTPAPVTGPTGPLCGGRLEALFDQRDRLAPTAQVALDALAQTLVERFSAAGLDPTVSTGAPGLFTDAGAAPGPGPAPGLSGRLAVNAAADPGEGGALWRLRDGLGAVSAGPVGDGRLLSAMADRLSTAQTVLSGPHAGRSLSLHALAGESAGHQSVQAAAAADDAAFAAARTASLRMQEASLGVDSDAELQSLLQFEKLYSANARVLQVVNDMFEKILGI